MWERYHTAEGCGGCALKITELRLFRVEGDGPAWAFEDRAVESLDLYPSQGGVSAGARSVASGLRAAYVDHGPERPHVRRVRASPGSNPLVRVAGGSAAGKLTGTGAG
jgi:hypothetical protein